MNKYFFILLLFFIFLISNIFSSSLYIGQQIGAGKIDFNRSKIRLTNNVLSVVWVVKNNKIVARSFKNKETNQTITWKNESWFFIEMGNGVILESNDFKVVKGPKLISINKNIRATKLSDKFDGKEIICELYNSKERISIEWSATIKDSSNYITQRFTLLTKDSARIEKVGLIKFPTNSNLKATGVVDGSPLAKNGFFCAIEHPMSKFEISKNSINSFIKRYEIVKKDSPLTFTTVWGVSPLNQLRRNFSYYIERERAVPYHHQLHYNSWYDLSWIDRKLDEKSSLDRIKTFGDSLILKRNVKLDAFLFDDGWDDNKTLWQFNNGFPNGFNNLSDLSKKYHSNLGVWISPWGGYDEAKKQRLSYGKSQNPPFEINTNGFSLSGPIYYKNFVNVVSNFIKKEGVSMFKFDGVGVGNDSEGADATYEKDINALLKLIPDLRIIKSDLYFSITVGTWPSPYWLFYGDAIWRNGDDTGMAGEGSKRQQWITFRDGKTYENIVKRGSLYPLNSLMYHGICIADHGVPDSLEISDKSISDEIWSFFGTGTALQELYINPHKLNTNNWNCLADAARWAKRNEEIMVDTHWVGGSPIDGQIYGFASWTPKKALLLLRNPSIKKQTFTVDVSRAFELPLNSKKIYEFYDVKENINTTPSIKAEIFNIELQPFEVKVYEAFPQN